MKREAQCYAAMVIVSAFLLGGSGEAQETSSPPAEPETTESDGTLREQTIYIPYENLRKSFEKEALAAVERFRYAPRFEDGEPVAVEGVKTRITFEIRR